VATTHFLSGRKEIRILIRDVLVALQTRRIGKLTLPSYVRIIDVLRGPRQSGDPSMGISKTNAVAGILEKNRTIEERCNSLSYSLKAPSGGSRNTYFLLVR
jgi:hypothetical protein